jgi:FkbM family methyltransferase
VPELVFTEVSVAGAPPAFFCLDPGAGDPVAAWFLDHGWIDEPVQRAFLEFVAPGMRVLDLGAHLGTFSLPAAALGASVLAVDATASHVEMLSAAAAHNGFEQLRVLQRVVSDSAAPVAFVERSIHGHVRMAGESAEATDVAPATVDALLAEVGWDGVELIKMDIEGMETIALAGMARLFARGRRPTIVLECNGSMLQRAGSSICELRERLVELGYELLMIDHLRPGTLVRSSALAIQPECVCDYIALAAPVPGLEERWSIEPPLSREQTLSRLLDSAASDGAGYRAYAADVLTHGPGWLRAKSDVAAALRALELDGDPAVRRALQPSRERSTAVEHILEREPLSGGRPPDMRVWARGLSVLARPDELERAPGDQAAHTGELLLEDVWLHVRGGQLVGLLCDRPQASSGLLRLLAGAQRPEAGELECRGRAVLLARVGEGLEGALSVAENIAVFGAYLGADVRDARRQAVRIADLAGLGDRLDAPLDSIDAASRACVALIVAFELANPELLLIDRMPHLPPGPQRDWLTARAWQLRGAGGSVVQAVGEAAELFGAADRILLIGDHCVVASGHPASVIEAGWLNRLGGSSAAVGVAG